MRLADKIALVTGAARGIGRGIALRFADEGAHVVVAELDVDTAQVTVGEVEAKGRRALAVECDVTQAASVQAAVDRALDEFGRIDILVNNAGTGQRVVETVDLDEAEWDRVLAVNITGVFICSKYVGRQMMRQDSGKIINLSSINGISGPPLVAAYNAAKWAVIGFTKTHCGRVGALSHQRECDLPRSGGHGLPESQHGGAGGCAMDIPEADLRERLRQSVPMGRWTTPEDIAAAATFLASDDSVHMTGEHLVVSGGLGGVSGVAPKRRDRSQ